jgi:putative tryptophan/tyrosine transport system substrate-binding protein
MGMTPREDRMANHIPRREFVITLGAVAAPLPIGALAQQAGKVYRIGFLANDPAIPTQPAGQAFLDGLRESGFIEGKNVTIDRRFAEGRLDRYADLVADLAQLRPDVSRKLVQPVEVRPKYLARTIPRTGLMELGGDHS